MTNVKLLEYYARKELDTTAPRVFAVTDPVLLEIVNFDQITDAKILAPCFPADPSKGTHEYNLTKYAFIEREDFSENKKSGFFGLMPEQVVCLRYGPFVKLVEVVRKNGSDEIDFVRVEVIPDHKAKVKGVI